MSRTAAIKKHFTAIDKAMAALHKLGFPGTVFGGITEKGGTVIIYNGNLHGLGTQLRETISESKK